MCEPFPFGPLLFQLCPQGLVGLEEFPDCADAFDDAIGILVIGCPFEFFISFERLKVFYLHHRHV